MNWSVTLMRMRAELIILAIIISIVGFLDPNLKKIPILGVDLDVEPSTVLIFVILCVFYFGMLMHFCVKIYREQTQADRVSLLLKDHIINIRNNIAYLRDKPKDYIEVRSPDYLVDRFESIKNRIWEIIADRNLHPEEQSMDVRSAIDGLTKGVSALVSEAEKYPSVVKNEIADRVESIVDELRVSTHDAKKALEAIEIKLSRMHASVRIDDAFMLLPVVVSLFLTITSIAYFSGWV